MSLCPSLLNCAVAGVAVFILLAIVDAVFARRRRMSLNGKVAVVTGGSSGIGLAAAKEMARQGATVVLIARRRNVLEEARAAVLEAAPGARVIIKPASVTDVAGVEKAFQEIIEEEMAIDVLLCSAGITVTKAFEDVTPEEFQRVMDVNVMGCANCARAVAGHMKRRKSGRICFVSSAAGQVGVFGYTCYSASKFALRGFAESLQMELAPYNIAVSLAFPPDTDTPMLAQENKTKPPETKEISGTLTLMQPDALAKDMVTGVKNGRFFINFDFLGNLLGWVTSGMAPTTGLFNNLLCLVFMPIGRIISVVLVWQFNGICAKHAARKMKNQ